MNRINQISKLVLSVAVLILALAALVFSLGYRTPDAKAVAGFVKPLPLRGQVFTQSSDGRTLYTWFYDSRTRKWKRYTNKQKGR